MKAPRQILSTAVLLSLTACDSAPSPTDVPAMRVPARASVSASAQCARPQAAAARVLSASDYTAAPTLANAAALSVNGGGQAIVTDIFGQQFAASFAISARGDGDGGAQGTMNFVFGPEFSDFWAIQPGGHSIHVRGKIATMSEGGGVITLGGTGAIETDVFQGAANIVFQNEPFEITITGPGSFTLWWCEVPPVDFEVVTGHLRY